MGEAWNVGDLVFVRIAGYPWWPGQVMAPEHVGSRFMAMKREGTFPVNFFGDNEFSWCQGENMVSFASKYDPQFMQKTQKQYKNYVRAVEEAKEVSDRRSGNVPETSHKPVDFLDPGSWPTSDDEDELHHASFRDLRPPPLGAEAAKGVTPQHAMQLLYTAAREEGQTPDQIDTYDAGVLRQLLFSYIKSRHIVAQGQSTASGSAVKAKSALKRKSMTEKTPQKKKQKLLKAGNTKKERKAEVHIMKESTGAVEEERPQANDVRPVPPKQEKQKIKQEVLADESDEDDAEPLITGREELLLRQERLRKFLLKARLCAADEGAHALLAKNATEFSACLRFREKVCSRSHRNKLAREEFKSAPAEAVGLCLLEAMRMPKCLFRQQTRKARKKSGIPVPVPESQAMADFFEYTDRLPETSTAFMQELEEFYASKDAILHSPQVDGRKLDLPKIFRAVAERGGYAAVTLNRQWKEVMHAWDATMNHPSAPTYIKQHYSRLLLAFENRLTMGAPHHSISQQRVRPATANQAATDGSKKAAKDSSRGAEKRRGSAPAVKTEESSEASESSAEDESDEEKDIPMSSRLSKVQKVKKPPSSKQSAASTNKVRKELLLKRRRHQEAHDAFKDLDDEPIRRPKKPKEAEMPRKAGASKEAEVDMVGQVLDNLRPPGPPQKQLRIRFKEAYELPTQLYAWADMKQITQDEKLKREAVLLNHVTKTVIINFRTEQDARLAHKCISKKKVVFKAPREAVELSLHVPGDDKAKAPVRRPHPASAQFRNGRPAGTPPAPRDPPVWPEAPQQDPRRAPAAPARETLMQRLAQRPSQPSTVTAIGDPRLLYGRAQQRQQQQPGYAPATHVAASAQAPSYAQPADPRRAIPADPRLASASCVASSMQRVPAPGGAPVVAQLQGVDLMAILQSAGISLPQQAQSAARDMEPEPPSSMQAPMLAGDMENMYSAPLSSGQWVGLQGMITAPAQQPKQEPGGQNEEPGQDGQPGQQENDAANMSDQYMQILERLKKPS